MDVCVATVFDERRENESDEKLLKTADGPSYRESTMSTRLLFDSNTCIPLTDPRLRLFFLRNVSSF